MQAWGGFRKPHRRQRQGEQEGGGGVTGTDPESPVVC